MIHTTYNCDRLSAGKPSSVCSFDLEWTKNYKISNGSRPFCYSFVSLKYDKNKKEKIFDNEISFSVLAGYVSNGADEAALISDIEGEFKNVIRNNDIIVGHQLTSDLSVIASRAQQDIASVNHVYDLWRTRNYPLLNEDRTAPRVFDTRYDAGHILTGKSRRLVDVCEEISLAVSQPELVGSMTKMQNKYLESGDVFIMERLATMNIRHSLSAALVCLYSQGYVHWDGIFNVNVAIRNNLSKTINYIDSDEFAKLL